MRRTRQRFTKVGDWGLGRGVPLIGWVAYPACSRKAADGVIITLLRRIREHLYYTKTCTASGRSIWNRMRAWGVSPLLPDSFVLKNFRSCFHPNLEVIIRSYRNKRIGVEVLESPLLDDIELPHIAVASQIPTEIYQKFPDWYDKQGKSLLDRHFYPSTDREFAMLNEISLGMAFEIRLRFTQSETERR